MNAESLPTNLSELVVEPEIVFINPTFKKLGFAQRAARSFFKYTPESSAMLLVDDASPSWDEQDWRVWIADMPRDRVHAKRFTKNGGLTRSWNEGLSISRTIGAKYVVCGNSDIVFTDGWYERLIYHLEHGCHLIGPVTNAPGATCDGHQQVALFHRGYQLTDNPTYLNSLAKSLREEYPPEKIIHGDINGFFMMARLDTWWQGCFDDNHVFNPAMVMTKNEDELQGRWKSAGKVIGFTPGSFIFHYRSVSRGDRFRRQGWFRNDDTGRPV